MFHPRCVALLLGIAMAGCAPAAPSSAPAPEALGLPAVPLIDGPLAIRVQYPAESALVDARDSNFIHGTVGTGRATLAIDGVAVPVHPNGAFIAFLPMPPHDAPRYELVAARDADTVRLTRTIRRPPPPIVLRPDSMPFVDSASVAPRGTLYLRGSERVRVSVRAAGNAQVWVRHDSIRRPLVPFGAETWAADVEARIFQRAPLLVVARGGDTVRLPLATLAPADSGPPRWALIGADTGEAPASAATAFTAPIPSDTDRVFPGRPTPAGGYGWFFFPRTPLEVTGRSGAFSRVRLDSRLEVWVDTPDLSPLPEHFPAPRRVVGSMQVNPAPGWADLVIPIGERPAYRVEERERALVLTLYDTRVSPQLIRFIGADTLVRNIIWEQEATDRARLTIELSSAPYGYLALWERGAFILRVRRPPAIADRARPLAGLTIVVDAGHPPAGATGPTGLYEGDLVLPVAQRVERMLAERGASVIMTRTTLDTLALGVRPIMARQANAHALVSIHLNALPDGVNPFRANGTSTLFFHPHAEPLARAIQTQLVRRFRIRDLGVHYQNIALGRPTWMPAVLAEGLFVMMPEQEYAVSTPQGQELYARGIVEGLEDYFRAQWTHPAP